MSRTIENLDYINWGNDLHWTHLINKKKYICLGFSQTHSIILFRAMSTTMATESNF